MSSSDSSSLSSDSRIPRLPHEHLSVQIDSDPPSPVRTDAPINPVYEKRVVKKVDRKLLPALSLVYTLAFIDVVDFTIARREGADSELKLLDGSRYYIISAVFFLPYIWLQLPFNFALRRVGGATWLGTILFLLGAVQITLGFVNDWGQFFAVRTVLGLLQAVVMPGCVYLISSWYTRFELQERLAIFYSASIFFGSFANILALGLSKIHLKGMEGWRWIFAIEGVVTVFLSFYAYTHILPFPDQPKARLERFLAEDEINLMRQRVELDRRDYAPDTLDLSKVRLYFLDGTIWAYGFLSMSAMILPSQYFSRFLYRQGNNFSDLKTQLLFIPPGVVAAALVLATGIVSDRLKIRGPFVISMYALTITGLCMLGFSTHPAAKYAGCILAYAGAQANIPTILAYQANNIRRHSKRLVTISLIASLSGDGGLLSVLAFPLSTAPKYRAGLWLALALQIAGLLVVSLLMGWLHRANRRADSAFGAREGIHPAEQPEGRLSGRRRAHSGAFIEGLDSFRYTL